MTEWSFSLNAVGMTSLHKAGLIGLTASLEILKDELPEELSYEMADDQNLRIRGLEKSAKSLHTLLTAVYELGSEGLINFPLIWNWRGSEKAVLQQLLLNSFLQHPRTRTAAKKLVERQEEIDEKFVDYKFLPLQDFAHRSEKTCAKWEKKLAKKEGVELASWVFPGAMQRHNAVAASALCDDPELYPLLLFAPIGCIYFNGRAYARNGRSDPKTETFVVVPKYTSLKQAWKVIGFYKASESENINHIFWAVGQSDAALQTAIKLELQNVEGKLGTQLSVYRFGKVPWSKQRTRTGIFHSLSISKTALEQYSTILFNLPSKTFEMDNGNSFTTLFPARGQFADNLVQRRQWYKGFADFMTDDRYKRIKFWSKELSNVVNDEVVWTEETQRRLVLLIQNGISRLYYRIYDQARVTKTKPSPKIQREYEKIRLAFAHARTKEQLRQELMDFLARTKARLKDVSDEGEMDVYFLVFRKEQDWREIRDLTLLALASYRGKGSEAVDDVQDVNADAEN